MSNGEGGDSDGAEEDGFVGGKKNGSEVRVCEKTLRQGLSLNADVPGVCAGVCLCASVMCSIRWANKGSGLVSISSRGCRRLLCGRAEFVAMPVSRNGEDDAAVRTFCRDSELPARIGRGSLLLSPPSVKICCSASGGATPVRLTPCQNLLFCKS